MFLTAGIYINQQKHQMKLVPLLEPRPQKYAIYLRFLLNQRVSIFLIIMCILVTLYLLLCLRKTCLCFKCHTRNISSSLCAGWKQYQWMRMSRFQGMSLFCSYFFHFLIDYARVYFIRMIAWWTWLIELYLHHLFNLTKHFSPYEIMNAFFI